MGADASALDDHEVELMNEYQEMMKDKVHRYVMYGIGSSGRGIPGVLKEATFDTHAQKGEEDHLCGDDLEDLETYCRKVEDARGVHILQGVHNSVVDNVLKVEDVLKDITKMVLETALIDAHLVLYYSGNAENKSGDWSFSDGTISYQTIVEIIHTHRRNRFLMVYIISDCCFSSSWVDINNKQIEEGGRVDPCIRVISSCSGKQLAKQRLFAQSFWGKSSVSERALLPQAPLQAFDQPFKLTELHRPWFDDNNRLELPPTVAQESTLHWHEVHYYGEDDRLPVKLCTQCEFDDCFLHCTECTWRLCLDCYNKRECAIKIFPEGDKYEGRWDAGEFHGEGTFVWVLDKEQYDGNWQKGLRHGRGKMSYKNGDFYDGEWHEGIRHGKGLLVYANGDRFNGELDKDVRTGKGTIEYANGDKFEGFFVTDKRECPDAMYTYKNGNVYRGPYVADKKCGSAECVFKNGDKFVGIYRNDVRCGPGKLMCENGDGYEGDFLNDHMHGLGVCSRRHEGKVVGMNSTELGVYDGEWRRSKKHGQGVLRYCNGDMYVGFWEDGLPHGNGTFTFTEKNEKYIGQFEKGKYHGLGHFYYSDGSEYEGCYAHGRKSGVGYMQYANQDQYEGDWSNDRHDGQGTRMWANGSRYDGTWRAGFRHGSGRYLYPNGETYRGEWEDDHAEGMGVYTFKNGNRYIGEFHEDVMLGRGKMVFPNGDTHDGVWRRDKRHPECSDMKFYRTDDDYVAKWDKGRRVVS